MIITIGGTPGSGKSTIAKMLAEKLNYTKYSMGDLRREVAKRKGMNIEEFNKLGEKDSSTDCDVDEYQTQLGKEQDNLVIEGRASHHFIPHSVKIYLKTDVHEAGKRIWKELQESIERNEGRLNSQEETIAALQRRQLSDRKRYRKHYKNDFYNEANFDFVLDTTQLTLEQVFSQVYGYVTARMKPE
ncbi:MAG: cytidylate kinase family protein [Nanoarchaeota archaeon]